MQELSSTQVLSLDSGIHDRNRASVWPYGSADPAVRDYCGPGYNHARVAWCALPFLLLFAWIGGVIGDNIGYLIGRRLGRMVLLRHGAKIGLTPERFGQIEAVFARYGPFTVAFARFCNVLRQLNGVVAGTLSMDWWRFLIFNALGCALWVLTWGLAGFYLGEHVSDISRLAHNLGVVGAIIVTTVLIGALVYAFRRQRVGDS